MSGNGHQQQQAWEFRDEACKVCGGRDFRVLGSRGGEAHRDGAGAKTRIVKCRTCNLIFPNPMPYPSGEDTRYTNVSGYFEGVMSVTDESQRQLGDKLAREAERLLGRRGRFLDVGCGRGEVVAAAQARGWEAEGCDLSEDFVRYAREVNGVRATAATLEGMNYPDASFDVVTLVEVIEHLYDPAETVRELRRVVRPGGLVYISTPNEESVYQSLGNLYYKARGLDWVVNLCPTWNLYHIQGFSPRSLRFVLERNDFRIENLVVYPGGLVVPSRGGVWGGVERVGTRVVERVANALGRSPYMYAWARRTGEEASKA
ncbi:MAG TPA: class I SAM-dependent methyltransferase [Pyrinomonadaceae bacterium]|nr:class I SAM-dependent methyltransferase [Pyrinomonadaceae bacterium]